MCDHEHIQLTGWQQALAFVHMINGVVYPLVALPSKALCSKVDLQRGEELIRPIDILYSQLLSPGLWLDIISIFGFLAEVTNHFSTRNFDGVPSFLQWCMWFQIGRGWRVVFPDEHPGIKRASFHISIGWLLVTLVFVAHIMASVLLTLGTYETSWGSKSWTDANGSLEGDCVERYILAFYFAVIGLTSVGYGDFLVTPLEFAVNSMFLLLAQLFAAKVCADLTWHTSTHNQLVASQQARRVEMWVALKRMQVPKVLATRVLAFQNYVATVHTDSLAQPAFAGLSPNLVTELRLCAYRKLVIQAPFLREQPKEVISLMVGALFDQVYLPADFVMKVGDRGREFYFVRRGDLAVYVGATVPHWGKSQAVARYSTGSYFGETAMLTGRPRAAWIMAHSYCICSVVPYSSIEAVGTEFPGAFTTLVQTMVSTLKMTASVSWHQVTTRMRDKYGFDDAMDAYLWFCAQTNSDAEELGARDFELGLAKLRVPELDRKIMWAEMDVDNSGFVSLDEFQRMFHFTPARIRSSINSTDPMATDYDPISLRNDWEKGSNSEPPSPLYSPNLRGAHSSRNSRRGSESSAQIEERVRRAGQRSCSPPLDAEKEGHFRGDPLKDSSLMTRRLQGRDDDKVDTGEKGGLRLQEKTRQGTNAGSEYSAQLEEKVRRAGQCSPPIKEEGEEHVREGAIKDSSLMARRFQGRVIDNVDTGEKGGLRLQEKPRQGTNAGSAYKLELSSPASSSGRTGVLEEEISALELVAVDPLAELASAEPPLGEKMSPSVAAARSRSPKLSPIQGRVETPHLSVETVRPLTPIPDRIASKGSRQTGFSGELTSVVPSPQEFTRITSPM